MEFKNTGELYDALNGVVKKDGDRVEVVDAGGLKGELVERVVYTAVFGDEECRKEARSVIKVCADKLGIRHASIHNLYEKMGKGVYEGFTVPAINIRGLTYDVARAVFRTARKLNAGAFIFEIARSEIGYTGQSPEEYATVITAAAIREGWHGPVFLQGDHYQVKLANYEKDKNAEIRALKELIKESIAAGFYNIDIDASTLVDLEKADVTSQQRPNFETTAALTLFIREEEPDGITVSIGGEIGEVGGKNSTVEELRAFMDGYLHILGGKVKGISKISVQTGTTHGGVVLPDGSVAKVKVDFDTIERLSEVARKDYGLAGVVQHGASTLPDDAFHIFPEKGTAEIHLATGFQNIIYESPAFPEELKEEIYSYLMEHFSSELKEGETEEQFIYKTRKKAFGPFKEKLWKMPRERIDQIAKELEEKFLFLFKKLNVADTMNTVRETV